MAFPHPRGGGAPQVGTVRIRAAAPSATGNRSGPTRHRRSSTWATSGLFCSGQSSPDMQYPIRERVRTHPTRASGRSARHDAQPSAFSIRTDGSRAPVLSATPDTTSTPRTRKIRLAREIRRPGEHRSPGKSASTGKSTGPTLIPPGTRPVRLCPAPLSFTGTFHAPFPSPQHVPRIAPPAEWHAP